MGQQAATIDTSPRQNRPISPVFNKLWDSTCANFSQPKAGGRKISKRSPRLNPQIPAENQAFCLEVTALWDGCVLKLRISDVGLLLDTYFQVKVSNSAPTMEDLLSVIKRRGLTLNNPIPKNPTLRNYEIITNALENDYSTSPDVVIIQETENVDDDKTRIKGRADGSVTQSSKLNYTRQP